MTHRATTEKGREAPSSRKRACDGEIPESAAERQSAPAKAGKRRTARIEVDAADNAPQGKERLKKEKVVRDTFTMPRSDYEKITLLIQRCLDAGVSVKKGELLRAGLILLASVPKKHLLAAVSAVERVRTGRPPRSH
ncbi:hypothetical protein [Burkholderia sp. Bp8963]|uniref:hypothetical protein n=1 Tax=Burkholderia sp. Bp8963 TaxID=2184547 RepID=UPI0021AB8774|nr:hypothetical protein [Burkholderia sp. Bp8963]